MPAVELGEESPLRILIAVDSSSKETSLSFQLADEVDIESLAKLTEGFSGSDLKELCRGAAVNRFRYLANSSDSKP